MNMMRPVFDRIGEIAKRHVYRAMLGRAGHGMRMMMPIVPGVTRYSGPGDIASRAYSNMDTTIPDLASRVMPGKFGGRGGGENPRGGNPRGGNVLDKVGNVTHKVGGILGGIENGIGTALRIGKAVAPFLPLAAAAL
jgi:hypothetical protein